MLEILFDMLNKQCSNLKLAAWIYSKFTSYQRDIHPSNLINRLWESLTVVKQVQLVCHSDRFSPRQIYPTLYQTSPGILDPASSFAIAFAATAKYQGMGMSSHRHFVGCPKQNMQVLVGLSGLQQRAQEPSLSPSPRPVKIVVEKMSAKYGSFMFQDPLLD